jgi:beta-lactam-binding protein with PASTA domain
VGKKLAAARHAIVAAHCSVGSVRKAYSRKKKGTVISERPAPGRKLARGAKVSLVVSRGRRP